MKSFEQHGKAAVEPDGADAESFRGKAVIEERGIFERLSGRAKEVAGVMLFMTALSLGAESPQKLMQDRAKASLKIRKKCRKVLPIRR